MFRHLLTLGLTFMVITPLPADLINFDDIEFWTGSGANEAAFVVDWNDGHDPWAWGYRWNGEATGAMMLEDLVRADPRLNAKLWDYGGGLGHALIGLGVDRDMDGFATNPSIPFPDDGYYLDNRDTSDPDGAVALDMDDSYQEGWWEGYWSYWVGNGDPYDSGTWGFSGTGASGRVLSDGDWDGWSFQDGFAGGEPGAAVAAPVPAAVPEPSSLVLLVLASGIGVVARRCRRREPA